ncbi:MAG: hypothetical protein ACYDD0_07990 [Candidatus Dormibacteria bacterium]
MASAPVTFWRAAEIVPGPFPRRSVLLGGDGGVITGAPYSQAAAAAGAGSDPGVAGSLGRGAGRGLLNQLWRFEQSKLAEIVSVPDYPGQRLVPPLAPPPGLRHRACQT